jgi:hypothetical protein
MGTVQMRPRPNLVQRSLLALWVILALMGGISDIPNASMSARMAYFLALLTTALASAILILMAPRTLIRYSLDQAFVGIGLFVIAANHFFNAVLGYDWFEGNYYVTPDWIKFPTYAVLGYATAIRSNAPLAILVGLVVALLDGLVGWAAISSTMMGRPFVHEYLELVLADKMRHAAIWSFCGLIGVVLSFVPWLRRQSARKFGWKRHNLNLV